MTIYIYNSNLELMIGGTGDTAEIISVTTEEQLQEAISIRTKVFVDEQKVPLDLEIDHYDKLGDTVHHLLICEHGEMVVLVG